MIKLLYLNNRRIIRNLKYLKKDLKIYIDMKAKHFHKFINKLPVCEPTSRLKIFQDILFFISIMF